MIYFRVPTSWSLHQYVPPLLFPSHPFRTWIALTFLNFMICLFRFLLKMEEFPIYTGIETQYLWQELNLPQNHCVASNLFLEIFFCILVFDEWIRTTSHTMEKLYCNSRKWTGNSSINYFLVRLQLVINVDGWWNGKKENLFEMEDNHCGYKELILFPKKSRVCWK